MDPIRFEQVLLNLLVNAREAQGDQGSVQVGCDLATVETSTGFVLPCPAGRYVRMVVADEGPGMVPEVVARAFEPLFTTRSSANGTGLGLAVVLAAVEQADGGIRLTTAPGEGARFEIFLPPAQTVDEASSELRAEGAPACLLVVEDDDGLRRVVVDLLREQGDEVLAAADGETALRLLPTHGARLDAVLLDLQLGRVSGGEVFAAIREAYPALPVLLTSGFIDAEEREALLRAPLTAFLPKPYRVATLTRALRSLRSQSSPG
jgi:CheY-like chemotaxis protein